MIEGAGEVGRLAMETLGLEVDELVRKRNRDLGLRIEGFAPEAISVTSRFSATEGLCEDFRAESFLVGKGNMFLFALTDVGSAWL